MRLVNCRTLELEEFFGRPVPPYYILSHRWTDDEVSYQDFKKGRKTESEGYKKIVDCCSFVLSRHHADNPECYVWIDTCCIDKKSSAELSEAINSMFKWYANAMCCYAHLFDVSLENFRIPRTALLQGLEPWSEDEHDDCNGIEEFRNSSWLTRGWTLQELLAPDIVVFVDVGWKVLGHKCQIYLNYPCERKTILDRDHLTELLSWITGIDCLYLDNSYEIRNASIACRMSWASSRSTTRVEDTAYCLLGIMGVNMPLLYGEGEMAFFRLQEELVKRFDSIVSAFTTIAADPLKGPPTTAYSHGHQANLRGTIASLMNMKSSLPGCLESSPAARRTSIAQVKYGLCRRTHGLTQLPIPAWIFELSLHVAGHVCTRP